MKINLWKSLLFCLFLISVIDCSSQIKIVGVVKDNSRNLPLGYACVSISNTAVGVYTNENGVFKLVVPSRYIDSSILVSYIGFKTLDLKISELKKDSVFIKLTPSVKQLPTMDVVQYNPLKVLRKTLDRLDETFYDKNYVSDVFYREMIVEDGKAVNLAESFCQILNTPFANSFNEGKAYRKYCSLNNSNLNKRCEWATDLSWNMVRVDCDQKAKIIESRTSDDLSSAVCKFFLPGGPLNILANDILKVRKFIFNYKFLRMNKNEPFKDFDIQNRWIDNEQFFEINYHSNDELNIRCVIGAEKYDIKELDFYRDRNYTMPFWRSNYMNSKRKFTPIVDSLSIRSQRVHIDYATINQKTFMKHIKVEEGYTYQFSDTKRKVKLMSVRELLVNDIDLDADRYKFEENLLSNNCRTSLFDFPNKYNETFWKERNTSEMTNLEMRYVSDLQRRAKLEDQFEAKNIIKSTPVIPNPLPNKDYRYVLHGDTIWDSFLWLEKDSVEKYKNYIAQENEYADYHINGTDPEIQKQTYKFFASYLKEADLKVQFSKIGSDFYSIQTDSESKKINFIKTKDTLVNSKKETIFSLDDNCANCGRNVYAFDFSPDKKYLYYLEFDKSEAIQFVIVDLGKKKIVDTIRNAIGLLWNKKCDGFYYIANDSRSTYSNVLYYHRLGSQLYDSLIYKNSLKKQPLVMNLSKSKDIIFVSSMSLFGGLYKYLDLSEEIPALRNINIPKDVNVIDIDYFEGKFYLTCNYHAKNNCVLTSENIDLPIEKWNVLIPETDANLKLFKQSEKYYFLSYQNGLSKSFKIIERKTLREKFVEPNVKPSVINFNSQDDVTIDLEYKSYFSKVKGTVNIDSLYAGRYDGKLRILDSNYIAEVFYYETPDHVSVPVVALRNKQIKMKKDAPVIVEVYGSGGAERFLPSPSESLFPFLDKGIVWAYVIVRGGGEFGYDWMMAGNGNKKMVSISDYIGAAEFVKDKLNTTHLFAYGSSAGGEIVANAVNNTTGLFEGYVLEVPQTNSIASIADTSDESAVAQWDLTGNPYDFNDYKALKEIDPYLNMKASKANILLLGGLFDSHVFNFYNAKYVAKQRNYGNSNIYFKTFMNSGHSFSEDIQVYENMYIYNFILKCMEKKNN